MRTILVALLVLPLAAAAQPGPGPGPGPRGQGPRGPAQGQGMGAGQGRGDVDRMERRMRLTRTLGLAEALDLEPEEALKLGQQIAQFDERRLQAHRRMQDAHQALRRAARGDAVPAAEVEGAIQRALDARAQIDAVDREMVQAVTKELAPEQKARAVLFLDRFQSRFGPGHGAGDRRGGMRGGPGAGGGVGRGPGPGACPDCPWQDDMD